MTVVTAESCVARTRASLSVSALTPLDAILRWPRNEPLVALVSGRGAAVGEAVGRWRRSSLLCAPGSTRTLTGADFTKSKPPNVALRKAFAQSGEQKHPRVGWFSYDVGAALEPRAIASRATGASRNSSAPLARFSACDKTMVFDHCAGVWRQGAARAKNLGTQGVDAAPDDDVSMRNLQSATGERAYCDAVQRAIEYIHAGDVFQVNIAQRITADFAGDARQLFVAMVERTDPPFAAYIESASEPGCAIVSVSPELFIAVDGVTGAVVAQPIKGTVAGALSPEALRDSVKDAAELAMIVDLMRNDLGRVCELGSVRVQVARAIERMGGWRPGEGVWHGVATIAGSLAPERDIFDLLAAALSAGSITGAPKIRAMQIIDELEPVKRGPFFGSIGLLDGDGGGVFNVAIRTATITGEALEPGCFGRIAGSFVCSVGAGVVAQSDPRSEWRESLDKAASIVGRERLRACGIDKA